jgi:hypothetical protein
MGWCLIVGKKLPDGKVKRWFNLTRFLICRLAREPEVREGKSESD